MVLVMPLCIGQPGLLEDEQVMGLSCCSGHGFVMLLGSCRGHGVSVMSCLVMLSQDGIRER